MYRASITWAIYTTKIYHEKNYSTGPTVNYLISEGIFSIDSYVEGISYKKRGESELNASNILDRLKIFLH